MDTYHRPITPPIDHSKPEVTTIRTSNGGITTIPTNFGNRDDMNDTTHQKQQGSDIPASSTHAPSSSNPFVSQEEKRASNPLNHGATTSSLDQGITDSFNHKSAPNTSSINPDTTGSFDRDAISSFNRDTAPSAPSALSAPAHCDTTSVPDRESVHKRTVPSSFDSSSTGQSSKKHTSQRNNTTYRIENEVLTILQWKNPIRSGAIFAIIVGSIILTRWYSLLQIGSACITLAIGINLIYVNLILQSQKVLTNQEASHPYSDVIDNEKHSMINKQSVNHYSTVITELSETVIRALTRIIFIENTMTSIKWMTIFFAIWKISAHFSTMDIVLMVVISAFTFPRLYISNKDVVDAQIQKGQSILQSGINKAQTVATENVQNTYVKARAFVAHAGTTGTDAKNTMQKSSVTLKDEKSL